MSEPLEILAPLPEPRISPQQSRRAVIALLIACAAWGGSFTWAKVIMSAINQRSGLDNSATLGVMLLLGWRFLLGGAIWMVIFPAARRGWSRASVGRAALLALPFTVAMIAQQMSLMRVSPAVNAFLTSLTVLFVPMIVACITRRLPAPGLAISVILAVAGIWMLSNPGRAGIGWGEVLGVGCSVLFSVHIILINVLLKHDTSAHIMGGQMLITGIVVLVVTLAIEPAARSPQVLFSPFAPSLLGDFGMLLTISTLLAFALMIFFQPFVDPSRAALIYLTEPVFAAAYAWVFAGGALTAGQLAGAALIIVANSLVEYLSQRRITNSAISAAGAV